MEQYLSILDKVMSQGRRKSNRTGVDTISVSGVQFEHDMQDGFPLLTTKEMRTSGILSELEFFIKGKTDKGWLKERNNHIWDDWCNPEALREYSFDDESIESDFNNVVDRYMEFSKSHKPLKRVRRLLDKALLQVEPTESGYILQPGSDMEILKDSARKIAQYLEDDLGPIYGWQWRHFGGNYGDHDDEIRPQDQDYSNEGIDQLEEIVEKLKSNPMDRRMICTAWNPEEIGKMALPPCHYSFQVLSDGKTLDLIWQQRSVDTPLGLPFNIASYGTLLHLLAKEADMEEGRLVGQLGDVHIYENQLEGAKEQLTREPYKLPKITTENFASIYDWKYTDSTIKDYEHHPKIKFPIAV
ncbi:MAG: thymidylate synthase [Candidatus Woesearchaeota archaeon]